MKKSLFSVKDIARIAILGALAAVLLMFNFPLPIAPSFYKLDFSDVPGLIGGFAMGPLAALMIQLVKIILNIVIEGGSQTAFVGEAANLIMSSCFCCSAAFIYRKKHDRKGAISALIFATVTLGIVSVLTNYFMIIPAYVAFMHFPLDAIIGLGAAIVPLIQSKLSFVIFATLPFNLVKGLAASLVTFVLYKRISPLLKN